MAGKARNILTIRVPGDLKGRIEKYSAMQGVSINQFAMYVFAKELGELESSRYFTRLLRNRNRLEVLGTFDAVMNKVRAKPVPSWDRIPARKKAAT
jgi:hypothetical protein